jgi:hypothetical protein
MLKVGDFVKVKNGRGQLVGAEVIQFASENMWWVKYQEDGFVEVTIFQEDDLFKWIDRKCTCGSASVRHPGHSYYCDLNV